MEIKKKNFKSLRIRFYFFKGVCNDSVKNVSGIIILNSSIDGLNHFKSHMFPRKHGSI